MSRLYLASTSPRRRELLATLGVEFQILGVEVDETIPQGMGAAQVVETLAARKAQAGIRQAPGEWVLGADTLVVEGDDLFGKPRNRREALGMLRRLSGTDHLVLTGVALARETLLDRRHAATRVWMRRLTEEEMQEWVAGGGADDKAGAYALQDSKMDFVERLEGSASNVVGLPLSLLQGMLQSRGLLP